MKSEVDENFFLSYAEWREAMIHRCRIELTPEYCAKRANASQVQVIGCFERAGAEG